MRNVLIFLCLSLCCVISGSPRVSREGADRVSFDTSMVERGIAWLELIASGAAEAEIKAFYLDQIATTLGCRSIIHHWERFRKWDAEEFYTFIMTALGRIPSDSQVENEDGTLTSFGRRRRAWMWALLNTEQLKKDLEVLRQFDLNQSVALAKKYLPQEAQVKADFYFVLFGASNAFSVGIENGYDVLQLPRSGDRLDMESILQTLAHELHHTGFEFLRKKYVGDDCNYREYPAGGDSGCRGYAHFLY